MPRILSPLVFLCAILLYGCSKTTEPAAQDPFFPLTEGNTWNYQFSEYDSTNALQISRPENVTVGKEQMINGESWHLINDPLYGSDDTLWYALRTDGLWERHYIANVIPADYKTTLKYKYPASTNDTFNLSISTFPPGSPSRFFDQVFSTNEKLNTSAGVFTCVHYQSHEQAWDAATQKPLDDTIFEQDYVSPATGLIESDRSYNKVSGGHFRSQRVLLSFTRK